MTAADPRDRLIVGLDLPTVAAAEAMVERLGDSVSFYKIGLQLTFAGGLGLAERLIGRGKKVFLDVKLLDIDNTVEHAVENIARLGMTFCTIHAYPKAMRAADIFDADTRAAIKRFTSLFEPLIILIMGVAVGSLILSMLLAITGINDMAM